MNGRLGHNLCDETKRLVGSSLADEANQFASNKPNPRELGELHNVYRRTYK
jgi:hypothetical protein